MTDQKVSAAARACQVAAGVQAREQRRGPQHAPELGVVLHLGIPNLQPGAQARGAGLGPVAQGHPPVMPQAVILNLASLLGRKGTELPNEPNQPN